MTCIDISLQCIHTTPYHCRRDDNQLHLLHTSYTDTTILLALILELPTKLQMRTDALGEISRKRLDGVFLLVFQKIPSNPAHQPCQHRGPGDSLPHTVLLHRLYLVVVYRGSVLAIHTTRQAAELLGTTDVPTGIEPGKGVTGLALQEACHEDRTAHHQ